MEEDGGSVQGGEQEVGGEEEEGKGEEAAEEGREGCKVCFCLILLTIKKS